MRLVFAGTPEFARIAFDALRAAGHDIPLVMTQPDRPAGRGLKLTPSPVKQAALDAGIEVAQPRSLRLDGRYPEEAAEARELPTSVPLEREAVRRVAANHKIRTDTGIEITFPAEYSKNPEYLTFTYDADGKIAIAIKNITHIENR